MVSLSIRQVFYVLLNVASPWVRRYSWGIPLYIWEYTGIPLYIVTGAWGSPLMVLHPWPTGCPVPPFYSQTYMVFGRGISVLFSQRNFLSCLPAGMSSVFGWWCHQSEVGVASTMPLPTLLGEPSH